MSTTGVPMLCISCGQQVGENWYLFPEGAKCVSCVQHEYLHQTLARQEVLHERLHQEKQRQP